jgi:hypothetical protein
MSDHAEGRSGPMQATADHCWLLQVDPFLLF